MKKLLLIITMFVFTNTIYSQQDSLNITQAERIIDKYSQKIESSFTKGIENITPMATEGFEMVVKLKFYTALSSIFTTFFILVISFYIAFKYYPIASEDNPNDFTEGKYGLVVIIFSFLGVVSFISTPFILVHYLPMLFCPEWYAIKEIIELF